MKLTFLGTGAAEGWPGMFCSCSVCTHARELGGPDIRARSGMLVDEDILLDFGPDVCRRSVDLGVELSKVQSVFVGHCHSDHFYADGLEFRLNPFVAEQTSKPLTVYGNDTLRELGEQKRAAFAAYPDKDKLQFVELAPFVWHETGDVRVLPLLAHHNPRERCYLYVLERGGKRLLYGLDSGMYPEETLCALEGVRLDGAVLECTLLSEDIPGAGHCGFQTMLAVRDRLARKGCVGPSTKIVMTHFSHNGKWLHADIVRRAQPEGITVAYDGLCVQL